MHRCLAWHRSGAATHMSSGIAAAWRLDGHLDRAALEASLATIAARHDALGMTFPDPAAPLKPLFGEHRSLDLTTGSRADRSRPERERETAVPLEDMPRPPLDLLRGPLARTRLVRVAEDAHLLILVAHRATCDRASLDVFARELAAGYAASRAGRLAHGAGDSTPYSEFLTWESETASGDVAAAVASWSSAVEMPVPVFELPTDRVRPAVLSGRTASSRHDVPRELAERLHELGVRHDVSLRSLVIAGVTAVLARYADQSDVVMGLPVSVRDDAGFERTVGCFEDTRLLRTNVSDDPSFLALVSRQHKQLERVLAHRRVPFAQILDAIDREQDDPGATPLVSFRYDSAPQAMPEADGLTISPVDIAHAPGGHELAIEFEAAGADLRFRLVYSTDLFHGDTIDRMAGHLLTLLDSAVRNPESAMSQLSLLSEAEHRQIVFDWNQTQVEFPHDACLHQLFEQQVQRHADAVAVVCGSRSVSYGELNRQANRLAHYLRGLGVGPDVMVGICVDRSVDMVVGLLGIAKAGGAYVPIDPGYPEQRLQFMLEDAQVPVLLTHERLAGRFPPGAAQVVRLDADAHRFRNLPIDTPDSGVEPRHLSYVIYTSGSTGHPKGVMLDHRGRVNNFCDFNRRYAVGPGDRVLALSSLSFDMSAYDVFGTLATGGTIIVPEPDAALNPAAWARLMMRHGVTVWHSVPALLELLVDHIESRPDLHPTLLRLVLLGGDWIPLTLPGRIQSLAGGVRVVSMGGATECSMDSTIYDIDRVEPDWKSVPYGKPMANQRCYILDRRGHPMPVGVPGELHLGGIGVARGYLKRPELTAQKFVDNPFLKDERIYRTGDLARYRPDGNIELLGRIDFQVKVRGFRVELGEIEAAIREHPAVKEGVVLAKSGKHGEKRLVAYVVRDPSCMSTPGEVREWHDAQVAQWARVYDAAYGRPSGQTDPTFNISSWDSSYTGEPLPREDMQEWVEATVTRIKELGPRRVLEIGCGLGLLLFRLAPGCERYVGTDISRVALDYVGEHAATLGLSHVELQRRTATDLNVFESNSFDTVVLNSIIFDFPSADYLKDVLREAARVVRPGGTIFVGDVRSLHLLEAFATSVQVHKADPSLTIGELRQRVRQQISLEEELLVNQELFLELPELIPAIGHVQLYLKSGVHDNELIKFRYDVTLHVNPLQPPPAFTGTAQHWQADGLSVDSLSTLLRERVPDQLWIRGIPLARTRRESRMVGLVAGANQGDRVGSLEDVGRASRERDRGIDPEHIRRAAVELGFDVNLHFAATGEPDLFDAIFVFRGRGARVSGPGLFPAIPTTRHLSSDALTNHPLRGTVARGLVPALRRHLEARLPDYMVPSAFVVLDAFPLSPNGKVSRRDLPDPDTARPELEEEIVRPRDDVETVLADIWADALGLDEIGVRDGFIQLGGSSLLAAHVAARVQECLTIELTLADVQRATIEGLARRACQEGVRTGVDVPEIARTLIEVASLPAHEVDSELRGHDRQEGGPQ